MSGWAAWKASVQMLHWTNIRNTCFSLHFQGCHLCKEDSQQRQSILRHVHYLFWLFARQYKLWTCLNCIRDVAKSVQSEPPPMPCPARRGHSLLICDVSLQSIEMQIYSFNLCIFKMSIYFTRQRGAAENVTLFVLVHIYTLLNCVVCYSPVHRTLV